MKQIKLSRILAVVLILVSTQGRAQFGGLTGGLLKASASQGAKILGVDKMFKQPQAITTSFEDVNRKGERTPGFMATEKSQPLYLLPKATEGGYVLCEGLYEMTNKSYCLKAGTFAPSKGDGYMYAPIAGPKEKIVVAIIKNAEKYPEVPQHDIQALLWIIIARTKFADYNGPVKLTAVKLLTTKQLTELEGGALGILPVDVMQKAKDQLPDGVKAIFEAENNIRQLVSSGDYTYADLEKYAIIAGMAPPRSDVPSGMWTLHSDGYYIRYQPEGYSRTKVQVYVPKELIAGLKGKKLIYDAAGDIACPANTGSQRLAQTNEPIDPDYNQKLSIPCTL